MKYYLTQVNNNIFGIWAETDDLEIFLSVKDFLGPTAAERTMRCHKNFIKTHAVASANDIDDLIGLLAMESL